MNKKILLIGCYSKLGKNIIKRKKTNNFNISSTYNKNKIFNNRIKQYKIDLNNLNNNNYKILSKNFDYILMLSGHLDGKSLIENNFENINKSIQINLSSQIMLLKHILKFQRKKCLLIFISSISGRKGSYDPTYAAAKGGIITFSKSLSMWLAPKVKCITLCPGLIKNTKMYKSFNKERISKIKYQTPNKELLNISDLSKIIIDLMQPHWKHANGSVIDINGGIF